MDPYDILNKLDALIQSRSILRHPFYVAWQEGTLTKTQLATYARMYWPHVAAFPSYLEASMEKTADPVIRETLARNLHDERTNPKPHPELWLDFATSLGQSRQEVITAHRKYFQKIGHFQHVGRCDSLIRIRSATTRSRLSKTGWASHPLRHYRRRISHILQRPCRGGYRSQPGRT